MADNAAEQTDGGFRRETARWPTAAILIPLFLIGPVALMPGPGPVLLVGLVLGSVPMVGGATALLLRGVTTEAGKNLQFIGFGFGILAAAMLAVLLATGG